MIESSGLASPYEIAERQPPSITNVSRLYSDNVAGHSDESYNSSENSASFSEFPTII